ncbi:MAG: translational machinery protein [Polyangiales bacterium]
MHHHAVVWIDHHQARLFSFAGDDVVAGVVHAYQHHHHPEHRKTDHVRPLPNAKFLHDIVTSLAEASEILVVGPSSAKLEFLRFAHEHAPDLEKKIVGVETVDHPTDRQLVAYARHYFVKTDPLR